MPKKSDVSSKGSSAPKSEWIDISYPLSSDMLHWPEDPLPPRVDWLYHPDKGHRVQMAQININVHDGTHIDTPRHYYRDGTSIDKMPLDAIIGPARVIEIKDTVSIEPEELEPYNIQAGERILFKTINSSYYKKGKFVEDYVYVSTEAARFLKDKKVSVVGIDYFAIGPFKDRKQLTEVHKVLLDNGIWIIETIDLSAVKAGQYEIICLPARVKDGDSAPTRAILRPL
jgi:arylformamidase